MNVQADEPLTPLQEKLSRMMEKSPRLLNILLGTGIGIITEVRDDDRDFIAATLKEQGYDLETESVPEGQKP